MSTKRRNLRRRASSESDDELEISTEAPQNELPDEDADDVMREYEEEERDRQNDIKERDAFVQRLLSRDGESTKKVVRGSRLEEDLKRLERGEVTREELLVELKKKSRWEYLKKRQLDKLQDLEAEIRDEETFFGEEE